MKRIFDAAQTVRYSLRPFSINYALKFLRTPPTLLNSQKLRVPRLTLAHTNIWTEIEPVFHGFTFTANAPMFLKDWMRDILSDAATREKKKSGLPCKLRRE